MLCVSAVTVFISDRTKLLDITDIRLHPCLECNLSSYLFRRNGDTRAEILRRCRSGVSYFNLFVPTHAVEETKTTTLNYACDLQFTFRPGPTAHDVSVSFLRPLSKRPLLTLYKTVPRTLDVFRPFVRTPIFPTLPL